MSQTIHTYIYCEKNYSKTFEKKKFLEKNSQKIFSLKYYNNFSRDFHVIHKKLIVIIQ